MPTTCTNCPAMIRPVTPSGYCCAGYRTVTTMVNGRRERAPMTSCERPATSAALAQRLDVIARHSAAGSWAL